MNKLFDVEFQVQLALSQLRSLAGQLLKLWGLLVFVLVMVFGLLDGFGPLWIVTDEGPVRALTILSGLYAAWTLVFTGFLQRQDSYNVSAGNVVESVEGNKTIVTYVLAMLVGMSFFVTEQIIGVPHTAFLAICAFVQLLPLFMGDSFKEQAENLLPFLANVALMVVAVYYLAVG